MKNGNKVVHLLQCQIPKQVSNQVVEEETERGKGRKNFKNHIRFLLVNFHVHKNRRKSRPRIFTAYNVEFRV